MLPDFLLFTVSCLYPANFQPFAASANPISHLIQRVAAIYSSMALKLLGLTERRHHRRCVAAPYISTPEEYP